MTEHVPPPDTDGSDPQPDPEATPTPAYQPPEVAFVGLWTEKTMAEIS